VLTGRYQNSPSLISFTKKIQEASFDFRCDQKENRARETMYATPRSRRIFECQHKVATLGGKQQLGLVAT